MVTLALAWHVFIYPGRVLNPHMAMAIALVGKQKYIFFLRELIHKGGCYCFGGCVCLMGVIWAYGHYKTRNHQNARLPAWVILLLVSGCVLYLACEFHCNCRDCSVYVWCIFKKPFGGTLHPTELLCLVLFGLVVLLLSI